MKVLHISFHSGCFKDQHNVLSTLGFEVTNLPFYPGVYTITREVADAFWTQHKELINAHDYVLISDTSAISRVILQNISEFKSKLVIWICNRFDYAMWHEPEFYELFNSFKEHPQVKITCYTFWEKIWCLKRGIDVLSAQVITPLGKALGDTIPEGASPCHSWKEAEAEQKEVIVPGYRNDVLIGEKLKTMQMSVYHGKFKNVEELSGFKAYVTQPDAMSKLFVFESIHAGIPVILPSKRRLLELCKGDYLFNLTGHGGGYMLTDDLAGLCEWYNPEHAAIRFYFDSEEEIPEIVKTIDKQALLPAFKAIGAKLEKEVLTKWKKLYTSF